MATAKRLPSGTWRVRVYSHTDEDGKKHYKSFTASTKKEAERAALEFDPDDDQAACLDMTLREAMAEYISDRSRTLSPRTVMSYRSMARHYYADLADKPIRRITQTDIQRLINQVSGKLSPKTVRNVHGFLTAVLYIYRPDFPIRTALPKKTATQIVIPTEEEIQALVKAIKGTDMELPVLLAAFGPMRRGEICALKAEDISGNIVHVRRSIVKKELDDGSVVWVEKTPKSYAGDRYIEYPDFVRKVWEGLHVESGRLLPFIPSYITRWFPIILKKNGIRHFRFHDLRHYSASIQHALGVPDAYIMQRGGWGNDSTLKQVYRHTMEEQARKQAAIVNDHFTKKFSARRTVSKNKKKKAKQQV